jgi:hypothetical protein
VSVNAGRYGWATGRGLQQVGPGFYVDATGAEYFYLTGLYISVGHRLLKDPMLNTPTFVSDVLCELRSVLEKFYCTELMD